MMNKEVRLVIVVRADPVICGHAGEARHLAEAAMLKGFSEVRILTWPLEAIEAAGLPTKPLDSVAPYSDGIFVERPPPLGDYRVPDGRFIAAMTGRLVELLSDGMETIVLCMYLHPHLSIVQQAVAAARSAGRAIRVHTVAEAVGSDITNVVRSALEQRQYGAAMALLGTYLQQDLPLAVSQFTKDLIVQSARELDAACNTHFAEECNQRVAVSYPAVDAGALQAVRPADTQQRLALRHLEPNEYILFLSRITEAKGVEDLVVGYRRSHCYERKRLVIAGRGPALQQVQQLVDGDPWITLLQDVDDTEKLALMQGCAAYVLPSKPKKEFVETFGIALVEKMLVGGFGPVLTTTTGGIPEAVGQTALTIEAGDPDSIAKTLDHAILHMPELDRWRLSRRARAYAQRFDRSAIFDAICARLGIEAGPARDPQLQRSAAPFAD